VRHVFDANCWRIYLDEKLASCAGVGCKMFEPQKLGIKILFDASFLMRQQYISLRRPYAEELFNHWFEEALIKGRIDLIDISGVPNLFAELKALGVPKGEHVYFRVAVHGKASWLISLDSDFYDPRKKKIGEQAKEKLVRSGSGPVCRHMKKKYALVICCPEVFCGSP
jgi:hypothetical protein